MRRPKISGVREVKISTSGAKNSRLSARIAEVRRKISKGLSWTEPKARADPKINRHDNETPIETVRGMGEGWMAELLAAEGVSSTWCCGSAFILVPKSSL
ncbi:MAG: hypothetical protein KDD64_05805 [Bdellovibrionales bacterium]|nr:hypothetical protein [Bdellovibrionales bacterium]